VIIISIIIDELHLIQTNLGVKSVKDLSQNLSFLLAKVIGMDYTIGVKTVPINTAEKNGLKLKRLRLEKMNSYVRLNKDIEDKIYRLRVEGLSRLALAERFGVSENRITQIVVKVKKRKGGKGDV